jgi:hypothetical protein
VPTTTPRYQLRRVQILKSKSSIVALHSKYSKALTFENFCFLYVLIQLRAWRMHCARYKFSNVKAPLWLYTVNIVRHSLLRIFVTARVTAFASLISTSQCLHKFMTPCQRPQKRIKLHYVSHFQVRAQVRDTLSEASAKHRRDTRIHIYYPLWDTRYHVYYPLWDTRYHIYYPTGVSQRPSRPLVCSGQTSPHRPRLVVSHSTCPPLSPFPSPRTALL